MGYSYPTKKYPISADVDALATQLAQRQSDSGTTNGGITAAGGSSAVPQLGVDAAGLGLAYFKGMADALLCASAYQDRNAQVVNPGTNVPAAWNNYGNTYTFSAPFAKTYLVSVDLNVCCIAGGSAGSCYFRLSNTTTSTLYDDGNVFAHATAAMVAAANLYVRVHFDYPVAMVAGSNALNVNSLAQFANAYKGDANCTLRISVCG